MTKNIDNPYPEDIFSEPTKEEYEQIKKLFKDAGLIQDKFFGAYGRKVWNNCIEKVNRELESTTNQNQTNQTYLILDDNKIIETFEALCSLPYVEASSRYEEPSYKREAGIEQLIEQLEDIYRRKTEIEGNSD